MKTLIVLRVEKSTFEDILARVRSAGQGDRLMVGGQIDLSDVAIEAEPPFPTEQLPSRTYRSLGQPAKEVMIHHNPGQEGWVKNAWLDGEKSEN